MMHSFIGFLFDLITCQVKFNKKEDKVSLISYKYTVIKNNNICFQQYYLCISEVVLGSIDKTLRTLKR